MLGNRVGFQVMCQTCQLGPISHRQTPLAASLQRKIRIRHQNSELKAQKATVYFKLLISLARENGSRIRFHCSLKATSSTLSLSTLELLFYLLEAVAFLSLSYLFCYSLISRITLISSAIEIPSSSLAFASFEMCADPSRRKTHEENVERRTQRFQTCKSDQVVRDFKL